MNEPRAALERPSNIIIAQGGCHRGSHYFNTAKTCNHTIGTFPSRKRKQVGFFAIEETKKSASYLAHMMFGDSVLFGGEVVLVVERGQLNKVCQVSGRSAAVGVPHCLIPQELDGIAVPGNPSHNFALA